MHALQVRELRPAGRTVEDAHHRMVQPQIDEEEPAEAAKVKPRRLGRAVDGGAIKAMSDGGEDEVESDERGDHSGDPAVDLHLPLEAYQ